MKKLLAIVMAAVLAMALGVAVYADDYSYEAAAGYTTFINTTTDTALTTAADALGDDAVITFTFTAPQDISSYSYFELQLRDAGWAPWPNTPCDNYTLCDVKASGSNTFSITYGELKAIIEAESFDVHSMQFICNTDPNDPGPIAVAVSVAPRPRLLRPRPPRLLPRPLPKRLLLLLRQALPSRLFPLSLLLPPQSSPRSTDR